MQIHLPILGRKPQHHAFCFRVEQKAARQVECPSFARTRSIVSSVNLPAWLRQASPLLSIGGRSDSSEL
jgi:hypothetical protein